MEETKNIADMRIGNRVQLTKVYVGSGDNFIVISGNDISIFDRFQKAGYELEELAAEMENKEKERENKENDFATIVEERKYFSEKATEIMDKVLGDGSTKKFFGDVYALIPNFQPDLECFLDFWDELIPVIEKLSEHKIKLERLASKRQKYQPQDYRKKA